MVADSAGDDGPDVGVFQVVLLHRLDDGLLHLLLRERRAEVDRLCGVVETVQVVVEPEDPSVVHPDPFKNPVPVKKAVVKNRDFGLFPGVEAAVDVDLHGSSSFVL
jgi:hypothetical protein